MIEKNKNRDRNRRAVEKSRKEKRNGGGKVRKESTHSALNTEI